jgi:hypothetical protein
MIEAKRFGWKAVTHMDLVELPKDNIPAEGMRPRLRGSVGPLSLFIKTWSSELMAFFIESANCARSGVAGPTHTRERPFNEADLYSLTAICLKLMGTRATTLKDLWVDCSQYGTLGQNRYKTLRKYLEFTYGSAFDIFNKDQRAQVKVGAEVAIDESSWPYHGPTDFHVFLPRKPEPNMIRAYTVAMPMSISNRPYCVGVLPDLRRPTYTDAEIFAWTEELLRDHRCHPVCDCLDQTAVDWTADKFFGNLAHLEAHPNQRMTLAISAKRLGAIGLIGKLGLKRGESRVFSKGNVLLSVYVDNKVLWTVSNCFGLKDSLDPDLRYRGTNFVRNVPSLSEHAFQNLLQWSADDLARLADRLSLSTSGTHYLRPR